MDVVEHTWICSEWTASGIGKWFLEKEEQLKTGLCKFLTSGVIYNHAIFIQRE